MAADSETLTDLVLMQIDLEVDRQGVTWLVAVRDSRIVGNVELIHKGRVSAGLCKLFVVSNERNRHVGTALVNRAVRIAEESGCLTMGASLHSMNFGLMEKFYAKLGFIFAYQYDDGSTCITKVLNPEPVLARKVTL